MDPKRVLLVDDADTVRRLMDWILRPLGFETLQAADGREALEVLRREAVHLAIVDLNMPVMDGISLVKALRAEPAWKDLPVIMMTTEKRETDLRAALDAGVNLLLQKPSTPGMIRYKVLSLLGLPAGETPS
jgi:two-component system chemotaxis response regulator CheY